MSLAAVFSSHCSKLNWPKKVSVVVSLGHYFTPGKDHNCSMLWNLNHVVTIEVRTLLDLAEFEPAVACWAVGSGVTFHWST